MKLKGVKEIYAIFVSLFMDKMEKEEPIQIDIEKVIKKKVEFFKFIRAEKKFPDLYIVF